MNNGIAVQFCNVTKAYQLGIERAPTLREFVLGFGRTRRTSSRHVALQDVSFDIPRGQVLGVIGENGSGKSTILKLVAGITDPDAGTVRAAGRISSLLEVGAGFHPDMTGRENVYLNGAILGMSRNEIQKKFDAIVAFSELEEFIDTPVKFYSSGMYMRLGFSVGIHVNPEIMVVDEILAVGDELFQLKCKERIKELKRQGVTLLFVSHDLRSVQEICDRALLLDHGKVAWDGSPEDAVSEYHALIFERVGHRSAGEHLWVARNRFGTQELQVTDFYLTDEHGQQRKSFYPGEKAKMVIEFESEKPNLAPLFSLALNDSDGRQVFSTDMRYLTLHPERVGTRSSVSLDCRLNLLSGFYAVTILVIPQDAYGQRDWLDRVYDSHVMTKGFTIKRNKAEQDVQTGRCFLNSHWTAEWIEPYENPYGSNE